MSARTELVAHLAANLPAYGADAKAYKVVSGTRETITVRTVGVWQQEMAPSDAGRDAVVLTLTVALFTPFNDARIEDDLEDGLLDVLSTINADPRFGWTSAQRAVFEDVDPGHGYKITVLAGGEAAPIGGTP